MSSSYVIYGKVFLRKDIGAELDTLLDNLPADGFVLDTQESDQDILRIDFCDHMSAMSALELDVDIQKLSDFVSKPSVLECEYQGDHTLLYVGPDALQDVTISAHVKEDIDSMVGQLTQEDKQRLASQLLSETPITFNILTDEQMTAINQYITTHSVKSVMEDVDEVGSVYTQGEKGKELWVEVEKYLDEMERMVKSLKPCQPLPSPQSK